MRSNLIASWRVPLHMLARLLCIFPHQYSCTDELHAVPMHAVASLGAVGMLPRKLREETSSEQHAARNRVPGFVGLEGSCKHGCGRPLWAQPVGHGNGVVQALREVSPSGRKHQRVSRLKHCLERCHLRHIALMPYEGFSIEVQPVSHDPFSMKKLELQQHVLSSVAVNQEVVGDYLLKGRETSVVWI